MALATLLATTRVTAVFLDVPGLTERGVVAMKKMKNSSSVRFPAAMAPGISPANSTLIEGMPPTLRPAGHSTTLETVVSG